MIAVYLLMTQFNLINHLWGLILIYSAGAPMGYLTQKGFFDTIPKAIDEAARIDGATNFQVFMKINLPLSRPVSYTNLTSMVTVGDTSSAGTEYIRYTNIGGGDDASLSHVTEGRCV